MRTIGDLQWLNSYIGVPYVFNGRDSEGVDCYGLCKLVYAAQYGIQLPDWALEESDLLTRERLFSGEVTGGNWQPLEEPVEGCFVLCYRHKAAYHMGLYYGGGVLHALRGFASTYQPLQRFKTSFNNIVFGEWTP
jgi:cell wall-associated NlpC family hydrolase